MAGASLRAAVVGAGDAGEFHYRAIQAAGGTVAALVDTDRERALAAPWREPATTVSMSIAEVAGDPSIDVVHICTPNYLHAGIATTAIDAGKHVVCEKPLATTRTEAESVAARARSAGVVAALSLVFRYYPETLAARREFEKLEDDVHLFHGSYVQGWLADPSSSDWRVDPSVGGPSRAFADIGSHLVDLAEFVSGSRISALCATTSIVHAERPTGQPPRPRPVTTEDEAVVLCTSEDGLIGALAVSQVGPGAENAVELTWLATSRTVRVSLATPGFVEVLAQDGPVEPDLREPDPTGIDVRSRHQRAFDRFMADVYGAIAGGSSPRFATFADGLHAAAITEAVVESSASGRWVEVAS